MRLISRCFPASSVNRWFSRWLKIGWVIRDSARLSVGEGKVAGLARINGGGSLRERVEAADADSGLALSGAERQLSQGESFQQEGKAVQDEKGVIGREAADAATEGSGQALAQETAVNDDPTVHTAAQNASIEEYKNSVDPKMAEYIDRVRAGEQLEPYVVTETSDRMRSAMMELTGLEKVGDRTLMDANAVQHITNRHAGGDGSADGTMKESADMVRAAYVLNNFDHAYLAKDRAEGYMTSRGKRAPIVIFEKK